MFGRAIDFTGSGSSISIVGNTIGLDANNEPILGSVFGIDVGSFNYAGITDIEIGGTSPGEGNFIAGHVLNGVVVARDVVDARISGNSIYANQELGIDLVPTSFGYGVTPNDPLDADTGGNGLQNFPDMTSATVQGSTLQIVGSLHSSPLDDFTIEFFASPACDVSGFGQGEVFLGTTAVSTDAAGNASFDVLLASPVSNGWVVTSTATLEPSGATSEFSACVGIEPGSGAAACADGMDNDGDGMVDFVGGDMGCDGLEDTSEKSPSLPCDDGMDNEAIPDGLVDFRVDASGDPGCGSPLGQTEEPRCQDGIDNDGQQGTDFDGGEAALGTGNGDPEGADPQCLGMPWKNRESAGGCGLGYELTWLMPVLVWLQRRRRRASPQFARELKESAMVAFTGLLLLATVLVSGGASAQTGPPSYGIVSIGEQIPGATAGAALAVNESSDTVGYVAIGSASWDHVPFVYTAEHGAVLLPRPSWAVTARARDVSDRHPDGTIDIVGWAANSVYSGDLAVRWRYSTVTGGVLEMVELGTFNEWLPQSQATNVNSGGDIVGYSAGFMQFGGPATLFAPTGPEQISAQYLYGIADVTDSRWVLVKGGFGVSAHRYHLTTGDLVDVGVPPGLYTSTGAAINESFQVAATATTGDTDPRGQYIAQVWRHSEGEGWKYIVGGGSSIDHARGINNRGDVIAQIVGGLTYFDLLYIDSLDAVFIIENLLGPGFEGTSIGALNDINDLGEIAASGPGGPVLLVLALQTPACSDGADNDGDGLVDLADPGCTSATDLQETDASLPCDDGLDNDGDGAIDYPGDPGCLAPTGSPENPACDDDLDNDGDGGIDWDGGVGGGAADTYCLGRPYWSREQRGCGLGFELAFLLPGLMRLRRRVRSA